jgi:hypothetical protein
MALATAIGRRIGGRVILPRGLLAALLLVVASLALAHVGHVDAGSAPHAATAAMADETSCLDHADAGHVADACGGALCASVFLAPDITSPAATASVTPGPYPGAHRPDSVPRPDNKPPIAG